MKNFPNFLLVGLLAFSGAAAVFAQDAAAPMRRSSPIPDRVTPTPSPTGAPRPTQTPAPVSPSPTAPPQTPSPAATARLTPAAPEKKSDGGDAPAANRSAAPKRSIINEKPVRALEPIKPFPRRPSNSPTPVPAKSPETTAAKSASRLQAAPRNRDTPPKKKPLFPFIRRAPEPSNDGPRAMRPTFDLVTDSSWTTAATIRSMENKWAAAIKAHDVEALEKLLADDFTGISVTGREGSKAKLLAEVRKDKNVYRSARAQGMKVRSLGLNVALVTGITSETGTTPEGKRFKNSRRFTDKWQRRNGRWQCIASKVTRLPQR